MYGDASVLSGLVIGLISCILGLFLCKKVFSNAPKKLDKKHVVITGGSSGIGKAAAVLAAKKGAHVTIVARNVEKLDAALKEIKNAAVNDDQTFASVSCDVSNFSDVEDKFKGIETGPGGPIYMLINCAGQAICGEMEQFSVKDIETIININLYGTIYPTKVILPKMKQRKEGIIVMTASQVALMGMFGYSIYSACKFALRGLAESIYMEAKPHGISVTLALPPDTDTPGFENENKTKPEETLLISEAGKLFKPEEVAEKLMDDALGGQFFSFIGFESYILTTLCTGMSPFVSFGDVILESLVLGPLRLIGAFYIKHFESVIRSCHAKKK